VAASPVPGCRMALTTSNTTALCRVSPPATLGMTEPGGGPTTVTSSKVLEVPTAFYLMTLAQMLRRRLRSTTSILRCRFSGFAKRRRIYLGRARRRMSGVSLARGQAKRPALTWRANCRGFGNRGTIRFVFGRGAGADSLQMVNHRGLEGGSGTGVVLVRPEP
jgi:hypothetical protein